MVTLGVTALRHYWLVRSVKGAADEVAVQLRQLQSRADSVSHPVVYGAWFLPDQPNAERWGTVAYDPQKPLGSRCSVERRNRLSSGVEVEAAAFGDTPTLSNECRNANALGGVIPNPGAARLVFFYARGNSTGGTVTVARDGVAQVRTIEVAALTGRVEEQE